MRAAEGPPNTVEADHRVARAWLAFRAAAQAYQRRPDRHATALVASYRSFAELFLDGDQVETGRLVAELRRRIADRAAWR